METLEIWRQNDRALLWSQPETAENHSEITRWLQVIFCVGKGMLRLSFLGLVKDLSLQSCQYSSTGCVSKLWQIRRDLQRKKCCASRVMEVIKSFLLDAQTFLGFLRVLLASPVWEQHCSFGHICLSGRARAHTHVHGQSGVNKRFLSIPKHGQFVLCYT